MPLTPAMHAKDGGGGMWLIAVRRKRVRWMWRHDRLPGELPQRRGLQPYQRYRRQFLLHPARPRENSA